MLDDIGLRVRRAVYDSEQSDVGTETEVDVIDSTTGVLARQRPWLPSGIFHHRISQLWHFESDMDMAVVTAVLAV